MSLFLSAFHGVVGGLSHHLSAYAESKIRHKIGGRWGKVGEPGELSSSEARADEELGVRERARPLP